MKPTRYASRSGSPASSEGAAEPVLVTGASGYVGGRLVPLLERRGERPGMKRGRRDPLELRPGDVVDCWRVLVCESPRRLLLEAEMRLPGRAWLQFEVTPCERGARIRQTALFDPVGVTGLAYWYLQYPAHVLIFRGMLRGAATRAARS